MSTGLRALGLVSCALLLALAIMSAARLPAIGEEGRRYQEEKRQANLNSVTIMASSASSTYTRFAEDIQNVLDDPNGLRVLPMIGRGGGQNLHDMLFLRGIDMATTDADYMRYYKQKDPALYGNIEQRIQYIAPLFNAEFHVLAGPAIRSVSDLKGRKVNFWKQASVTAMAAENIFRIFAIDVVPTYFDTDQALEKLRSGEISAMVRMSGAPHDDYMRVRADDGFHLLPVDGAALPKAGFAELMTSYLPSTLTHDQYPRLIPDGQAVPTVAGKIVLAVYAWPEGSERYQKLANFVKLLFDNIDRFSDPARHPKWREVNLAARVPGWTRFKPAQDWLDANLKGPPELSGDMKVSFEQFVSASGVAPAGRPLTAAQRDALFQQFLGWWRTQPGNARGN